MPIIKIAVANIRFPPTPQQSVALASSAIRHAGLARADLICFPECYVPGYRGFGRVIPPPDPAFLEGAWATIAATAAESNVGVVLGTERLVGDALRISALVINRDGSVAGFQDKVQLDPSEDATYTPGLERQLFQAGPLKFGIAICHEGFRYPETVRWAAQRGAHLVFHPHLSEAEQDDFDPHSYADPGNSFHEKAVLCRAAENTCFVVTANCSSDRSPTTSAIVKPDGTLLSYQPYNQEGLLVAEIDLAEASGFLASRYKPPYP
ncbi:MAG: carbon-nitrogen hydrolase family protein [Pseudomonadota bacterium]|nr:carbon-nitrogen hydrolase family protein [Pseudomonadota bacterium]